MMKFNEITLPNHKNDLSKFKAYLVCSAWWWWRWWEWVCNNGMSKRERERVETTDHQSNARASNTIKMICQCDWEYNYSRVYLVAMEKIYILLFLWQSCECVQIKYMLVFAGRHLRSPFTVLMASGWTRESSVPGRNWKSNATSSCFGCNAWIRTSSRRPIISEYLGGVTLKLVNALGWQCINQT